jgi:peroxiredoxin Q/BCP
MPEYEAKNTSILGISFDDAEANKRFAEKFDFPFPLLCDTDRTIGMAYGAADSPRDEYARRIAYLIDENGRIAEAHAKVDPRSYPKEQLARL